MGSLPEEVVWYGAYRVHVHRLFPAVHKEDEPSLALKYRSAVDAAVAAFNLRPRAERAEAGAHVLAAHVAGRVHMRVCAPAERVFLEDGDEVRLRGSAGDLDFGDCWGKILPAPGPCR